MTDAIRMDPELKTRWVEALRSGEYEQGVSRLKYTPNGGTSSYCCLGVLSELCGVPQETDIWDGEARFQFPGHMGRSFIEMPPSEWMVEKGISRENGKMLADMNDGSGIYNGEHQSFELIADYIQDNL